MYIKYTYKYKYAIKLAALQIINWKSIYAQISNPLATKRYNIHRNVKGLLWKSSSYGFGRKGGYSRLSLFTAKFQLERAITPYISLILFLALRIILPAWLILGTIRLITPRNQKTNLPGKCSQSPSIQTFQSERCLMDAQLHFQEV